MCLFLAQKTSMQNPRSKIITPLLVAAYPVLALLAHNIEATAITMALRALLISISASLLLFLIAWLIVREASKAALVVSITLILFFSYGHVYGGIKQISVGASILARHRLLAPLFLFIWVFLVLWVVRQKRDLQRATQAITLIAGIALLFPLYQISRFYINSYTMARPVTVQAAPFPSQGKPTPDIYYIILDAYSRDDTLKSYFNYDNTDFVNALSDMGFYVARCGLSNYAQTELSLGSSLNFTYLQTLDPRYADPNNPSRAGLTRMIHDSAARQFLRSLGYKLVAFDTGFAWTSIYDADIYLAPGVRSVRTLGLMGGANEFEVMLIQTSAGLLLADASIKLPALLTPDLDAPNAAHRQRVLYALDQLPELPHIPGPKFAFVHIVSPHTPYVFGPNGEAVSNDVLGIEGYRDQLIYLNKRILPILKEIIAASDIPPIIILQGDHSGVREDPQQRMHILNAYYLPGGGDKLLYENITPVNTFRLIFNYYFGASYPLLPDASYFSTYKRPFDFTLIQDERAGCQQ